MSMNSLPEGVPGDPFGTAPPAQNSAPAPFSASPLQAKRALQAHLAETERRLQVASELGTTLLRQRQDLTERLKEVEKEQGEGEIGPELRQKLIDLEKAYSDASRDSARGFLGSGTSSAESPFAVDERNPVDPARPSSLPIGSPSGPSRRRRNQPSRISDIEFATEVSSSLLAEVRRLQTVLAERDESLKAISSENSRLEIETEAFAQRLRALDESEHRYKEENWSLETHTHDLLARVKAATDQEKILSQRLSLLESDKAAIQRERDELKQANIRLIEDLAIGQKHYELELSVVKRNLKTCESERVVLQQKTIELTSQIKELTKALEAQFRHKDTGPQTDPETETTDNFDEFISSPDDPPPLSLSEATPRHSTLESETLKSSLRHAHRTIQTLQDSLHRVKTEKDKLNSMFEREEKRAVRLERLLQAIRLERLPQDQGTLQKRESDDSLRKLPKPALDTQIDRKSEKILGDTDGEEQRNTTGTVIDLDTDTDPDEESLSGDISGEQTKTESRSTEHEDQIPDRDQKQILTRKLTALQEERDRLYKALQIYAVIIDKLDNGLGDAQKQIRVLRIG